MPEREIFDSVANETTVINIPDMYANTDEDTLWYVNNVYSPSSSTGKGSKREAVIAIPSLAPAVKPFPILLVPWANL